MIIIIIIIMMIHKRYNSEKSSINHNIEKDRDAFEKYKYLIPVIEIDGKILFTGRIDRDRLKSALTQKSRS